MTRRELAALAFKIAGIIALMQAFPLLQPIVSVAWNYYLTPTFVPGLSSLAPVFFGFGVPILFLIAMALTLLIQSNTYAEKLYPQEHKSPLSEQPPTTVAANCEAVIGAIDLQRIAFSVVGVYMLATAFPRVGHLITNMAGDAGQYRNLEQTIRFALPQLVHFCTQAAVGLVLCLNSAKLAQMWKPRSTKANRPRNNPELLDPSQSHLQRN